LFNYPILPANQEKNHSLYNKLVFSDATKEVTDVSPFQISAPSAGLQTRFYGRADPSYFDFNLGVFQYRLSEIARNGSYCRRDRPVDKHHPAGHSLLHDAQFKG
jgi:hypothetical protein